MTRKKLRTSRKQRLGKRGTVTGRKSTRKRTTYQKYKKARKQRLGKRS